MSLYSTKKASQNEDKLYKAKLSKYMPKILIWNKRKGIREYNEPRRSWMSKFLSNILKMKINYGIIK